MSNNIVIVPNFQKLPPRHQNLPNFHAGPGNCSLKHPISGKLRPIRAVSRSILLEEAIEERLRFKACTQIRHRCGSDPGMPWGRIRRDSIPRWTAGGSQVS